MFLAKSFKRLSDRNSPIEDDTINETKTISDIIADHNKNEKLAQETRNNSFRKEIESMNIEEKIINHLKANYSQIRQKIAKDLQSKGTLYNDKVNIWDRIEKCDWWKKFVQIYKKYKNENDVDDIEYICVKKLNTILDNFLKSDTVVSTLHIGENGWCRFTCYMYDNGWYLQDRVRLDITLVQPTNN